jgi:hypothetical protein
MKINEWITFKSDAVHIYRSAVYFTNNFMRRQTYTGSRKEKVAASV